MDWQSKANEFVLKSDIFLEQFDKANKSEYCTELFKDFLETLRALILASDEDVDVTKDSPENHALQVLQYNWSIDSLDLAILIRDIHLNAHKKDILALSQSFEHLDETVFHKDHTFDYRSILTNAVLDTKISLKKIVDGEVKVLPEWRHQNRPNSAISDQLHEISQQLTTIHESYSAIRPYIVPLNLHREQLVDYSNHRLIQIRTLQELVEKTNQLIIDAPDTCSKTELLSLSKSIQKNSDQIDQVKQQQKIFIPLNIINRDIELPIYSKGGELVYKTINLSRRLESWTENEIFPTLIDIDSDINILYDSTIITLFNTRNKLENLALSEKETYELKKDQFSNGPLQMLKDIGQYLNSADPIILDLNKKIQRDLRINLVLDVEKDFLPEKSFIALSKLTGQKYWYESQFWSDRKQQLKHWLAERKIPFLRNLSEDPFSFVESRMIDDKDLEINSLFLKNGYIGRSFFIDREKELSQLNNAYSRWLNGFQGSVLFVGTYGSGKSSFVEYIPHHFTDCPVIQIQQNNQIQFNGRKHLVTSNLGDTLSFLAKQSISRSAIVCIDDLEKWQDTEFTLYQNIKELVDSIGKYGRRLFFVVSTNHFMLDHIERLFNFQSRFSEIINLDKMGQSAIANAIVIRHNASLKDYKPEENSTLVQKASKIARMNKFNVGASMIEWERYLESRELMDGIPINFIQLINKHRLILKIILANKKLSEIQLRQSLTSSDNAFISEEIRKLMGYKIVQRSYDGYLEINPFIVFDVESSLTKSNIN